MDISFEYFPAKTEQGTANLIRTHQQLMQAKPTFVSVTFGAGGSTQEGTLNTIIQLQQTGVNAAPHLSCVGATQDSIAQLLDSYKNQGVNRIVALRGDTPKDKQTKNSSFCYASDLVQFIRKYSGNHFLIEVAAYPEVHPQATSAQQDLQHFIHKVRCGADSAITQYFYNPDAFLYFRDQVKREINIPIIPGIRPITNFHQLARFSDTCGAEIPRWIRHRLQSFGDDVNAIRSFGFEVVVSMCQNLLKEGVEGLHFYTLNQAEATLNILSEMNLKRNFPAN